MRALNDAAKLELINGMIQNLEREYSAEAHAGYLQNARKIRGKLIPLYHGKNILTARVQNRQAVKNMFNVRAKTNLRIGA
jgi:hypothetical protein